MIDRNEELKPTPKMDTITSGEKSDEAAPKTTPEQAKKDSAVSLGMTDNKIPHRGVIWYVFFVLTFLASSALIVYLSDWALLFFVVVFAGVTLWRGNMGTNIKFAINQEGIRVNEKMFLFNQVESWYFSTIGDDFTITLQMVKKYLPRLTYIFDDEKYLEQLRKALGDRIPETEPREESILDFVIRKLKI